MSIEVMKKSLSESTSASLFEGPIVPRCLSALPADIEDLIRQFNSQGN